MRSDNTHVKSGKSFLSSVKSLLKAKFLALGLAVFAIVATTAPTSAFAASTPTPTLTASPLAVSSAAFGTAGTVTPLGMVPNRYECGSLTHKCQQINGAHVPSLPNACRWSLWNFNTSGMDDKYCNRAYDW